jgi:DNA-binding NtrC family response regulator
VRVLLVDDEVTIFVTLRDALEEAGHEVLGATDTDSALKALEDSDPEVVVTDVRLPGLGGVAILERSVELRPERPVILMTGYASVDDAVAAMRLGAVDYVQKPFRNETIIQRLAGLARLSDLELENNRLREELSRARGFEGIVGQSEVMQGVFERVRQVASSEATVLIQGESGTGKERIAQAVHDESPRAAGPFIPLSCAALPEGLLEAELFGHEKGAFTDARRERKGRFELAHGGTLFLDDIDDMPLPTQVKLLRVLQERSFERVGGERSIEVDIRVVVATKVDLREMVRAGTFRDDLYWRVHVVPVLLPPLRERVGDVPLLVQHLLQRHGGAGEWTVGRSSMAMLERYPWPGNVRELENAIQRGIALAGKNRVLRAEDLLPADPRWRGATEVPEQIEPLRTVLKQAEGAHLARALEMTSGHRTQCAELLGISRKVLWEKLREHKLDGRGVDADASADEGEDST